MTKGGLQIMNRLLTVGIDGRNSTYLIKESRVGKKWFEDMCEQMNEIINGRRFVYLINEDGKVYFYIRTDAITFFEYEELQEQQEK